MLLNLKNEIRREEMNEVLTEALSSRTKSDEAIKDVFLDSFDVDIIGAENDPKVKSLVDTVPEYDDHDAELEAKINTLTESLIETDL